MELRSFVNIKNNSVVGQNVAAILEMAGPNARFITSFDNKTWHRFDGDAWVAIPDIDPAAVIVHGAVAAVPAGATQIAIAAIVPKSVPGTEIYILVTLDSDTVTFTRARRA